MPAESIISPTDVRHQGEISRNAGMDLAASRKVWLIRRDTLRFLDAMMGRADRTATTDDAADDLAATFTDGGKWRGSIPGALAREGLVVRVGMVRSGRPSRHRGYVTLWKAADLSGIEFRRGELRQWLAEHPDPAAPVSRSLFDHLIESEVAHG